MRSNIDKLAGVLLAGALTTPIAYAVPSEATLVTDNVGQHALNDERRVAADGSDIPTEQIVAQSDPHIHDDHEKIQTHIHGDTEVSEYAKPDELPSDAKAFRVFFNSGSTSLSQEMWSVVEETVHYALELDEFTIFVEGFTDTVGSLQANHQISHNRAQTVRKALGLSGLSLDAVHIVDFGENPAKLLVPTADNTDEAQNRRAEIWVMSPHEVLHATDVADHEAGHDEDGDHLEEGIVQVNVTPAAPIDVAIESLNEPLVEGQGTATIRLQLARPAESKSSIRFTTLDGTAERDADYTPTSGVLKVNQGDSEAVIDLTVLNDDVHEESEDFKLYLSADSSTFNLSTKLLTILIDDD